MLKKACLKDNGRINWLITSTLLVFLAVLFTGCGETAGTFTVSKKANLLEVIVEPASGNFSGGFRVNNTRYTVIEYDFAKWFSKLYVKRDFKAIVDHVSVLATSKNQRKTYELSLLYDYLGDSSEKDALVMDAVLQKWCRNEPECYVPWLIRGVFEINGAWKVRGSGWASQVKAEAWPVFRKKLGFAKTYLEKAQSLKPEDPNSSSELIVIAYAQGQPRDMMEKHFNLGKKYCPWHHLLHGRKLSYLKPRWSGSVEERAKFLAECENLADKYPNLGLFKVADFDYEHRHRKNRKESVYRKEGVWPAIKKVYRRMLARHPHDLRLRSYYSRKAYKARKYEIAYNQFQIIGDRWIPGGGWTTLSSYHKFRAYTYYKYGKELQTWVRKQKKNSIRLPVLKKTLSILKESLSLNPTGCTYNLLGIVQWLYGYYDGYNVPMLKKAHGNLQEAVRLMPESECMKSDLKDFVKNYKDRLGIKELWMSNSVQ